MRKTALLILLLAVCSSAFAKTTKLKKKTVDTNDIQWVMVHHTVCYGRCPEYTVRIGKDGMVTYTGMRFSKDTGIFKKSIGTKKAKEIIDQLMVNRVDTCRQMYENRIPDLPGLTFTINYPNRKKMIYSANFGPEFLTEAAAKIDSVGKKTQKKGWKKTGMPKLG